MTTPATLDAVGTAEVLHQLVRLLRINVLTSTRAAVRMAAAGASPEEVAVSLAELDRIADGIFGDASAFLAAMVADDASERATSRH